MKLKVNKSLSDAAQLTIAATLTRTYCSDLQYFSGFRGHALPISFYPHFRAVLSFETSRDSSLHRRPTDFATKRFSQLLTLILLFAFYGGFCFPTCGTFLLGGSQMNLSRTKPYKCMKWLNLLKICIFDHFDVRKIHKF